MPKIKTHKATAKRFRLTGSGKLVRTKSDQSHLKRNKSSRSKRAARRMHVVETTGEIKRVKRLAPYLKKGK